MTAADRKDVNSSVLTYHRIVEAFKLLMLQGASRGRGFLGRQRDQIVRNMTNPAFGESLRHRIYDNRTFDDYKYYGDFYSSTNTGGTAHMSVYFPGRGCGRRHQHDKPLLWFKVSLYTHRYHL
ncbi:hypothetical protein OS493_001831 [Desmophyllum pertusum]|uniref:Uncharacterized protein n=1 Tax=Desmophyllum pertusum TaxID=174260 RepID=A0A9W9Z4W0_9CNID|nr:hypothetical protein OS493_001831 [Desmophyllum pertusum]